MDWPLASQYAAILQNPRVAFSDPLLQACQIRRNAHNLPVAISGQFAVVFQAVLPDGTLKAVRVFTSERPERTERYQAISDCLDRNGEIRPLVHFRYTERGIRAITRSGIARFHPLVVMEWVAGETLFGWLGDRCRSDDRTRLRAVAERWFALVAELESAKIAHGDLQHGNILVAPADELKLVDYDGMCVPALVGRMNLEVGVTPYQHPSRNAHTLLTPTLDRFSALLIYVAVRALAAEPGLWMKWVDSTGYDKILFRENDLMYPDGSVLYRSLRSSPDPEVPYLADRVADAFHSPMDAIPALCDIVVHTGNASALPSAALPASPCSPLRSPVIEEVNIDAPPELVLESSAGAPSSDAVDAATPSSAAVTTQPSSVRRREPTRELATLLVALRENDREKFCDSFDARVVRQQEKEFLVYRQRLVNLTRNAFRSRASIGLSQSRGRGSLSVGAGADGAVLARWTWPHPRFSQECVMGLMRKSTVDQESPDDVQLDMRRTVSRETYESGRGITVHCDRATMGCYVVVWAVIDLGFQVLYSEPLVLGALRPRRDSGCKNTREW